MVNRFRLLAMLVNGLLGMASLKFWSQRLNFRRWVKPPPPSLLSLLKGKLHYVCFYEIMHMGLKWRPLTQLTCYFLHVDLFKIDLCLWLSKTTLGMRRRSLEVLSQGIGQAHEWFQDFIFLIIQNLQGRTSTMRRLLLVRCNISKHTTRVLFPCFYYGNQQNLHHLWALQSTFK